MPDLPAADVSELLAAVSMAVVIGAVIAERGWSYARTGSAHLRSLATAAVMGVGALAVGGAVTACLRSVWPVAGALTPAPLRDLVALHVFLEIGAVFVAWDLASYAYHRIGHTTRLGWASHQVHHTGSRYDLSLALRQSWVPWPALVTFPMVSLTGGSFVVAACCAAVSNLWQALVHTEAEVPIPGWLAAVVVTPDRHRRHHDADGGAVNLGAVLTCWDRFAGTWDPSPASDGLPAEPGSPNPVAIELAGWRALAASASPGHAWGFARQRPTGLDCGD